MSINKAMRLRMRALNSQDYKQLFPLHSDKEVMKFIREADKDIKETQQRLDKIISYQKSNPGFGIFLFFDNDNLLGWGLLLHLEMIPDAPIELGYRLFPKFWGKNYATQIASELLAKAAHLGVREVCAVTHPDHFASQRVLNKNGFEFKEHRSAYGHDCKYFIKKLTT